MIDNLGNTLGEFEISIVAGTENAAGDYVITPETDSDIDTETETPETTQTDI